MENEMIDVKIREKILAFLKRQGLAHDAQMGEVKLTQMKNKNGENLLFIRALKFGLPMAKNYLNKAYYFAFDKDVNYLGCVDVNVLNNVIPNEVELEAWANLEYQNRGNMSALTSEVIKEIFEDKVFDGLTVRAGKQPSEIKIITLEINRENYPSLGIAKKFGFKLGYGNSWNLDIDTYKVQKQGKQLTEK